MCLRSCRFVSDDGLLAFSKSQGSLECLQLEECNKVTQSGIIGFLSNCGLKSLALVKCMGIRDVSLDTPLSSPCNSLKSLSVKNCPGFGTASLAMVGNLCPLLQHVDLSGLYGITDAGLLPLLESCREGLAKVNLSGCLNLTDEIVLALTRLHGGTLELLNLDGCPRITDASLVAVADNCVFLSDLDVSRCAISDSGVAALSHAEQLNLQVVSFSGCLGVSNKSMPFLKQLGKTLRACGDVTSFSNQRGLLSPEPDPNKYIICRKGWEKYQTPKFSTQVFGPAKLSQPVISMKPPIARGSFIAMGPGEFCHRVMGLSFLS
ncbi:EIN3-binding F-box protein 1 [Gossypium hirsutum]|uniref:EIN3-binding F-box protein 1 n=1 Tax=Gossypium hirsutum TaxID=3635 RepID=A0ABM3AFQ5_GOSHI|nr:EIN3-binding F-box protein 1-like [Gossypium hirsutum]